VIHVIRCGSVNNGLSITRYNVDRDVIACDIAGFFVYSLPLLFWVSFIAAIMAAGIAL